MRIPFSHRPRGLGFDMTPMIDVVFLLIIFFLVSSHLARQEIQQVLPLPMASSGQAIVEEILPRVTINVFNNGVAMLAGRMVSATELRERLQNQLAATGPSLEVRIRSDRHVAYRHVEPIMLAAAEAGIWNVTFAVVPPQT